MSSERHLRELEEKYEDFKVYDRNGEKIGKVDDLFIDESDREEYIGVKMGFFGLKSTLIPMEVVRVNEAERRIEVSETKDMVKDAPTFSDDDEIDARFEENIRRHFNLESGESSGRGSYSAYAGAGSASSTGTGEETTYGSESQGYEGSERGTESRGYEGSEERYEAPSGEGGRSEYQETGETQGGDSSGVGSSGGREIGETSSGGGEGESRSADGGRARVRRRVIREEIIEEDPNDPVR